MATNSHLPREKIGGDSPKLYSTLRSTIETAYHQNNVIRISTLEEAYTLAKNSPGTIITDLPVYRPEAMGLPDNAKVLLFNDGAITGRQAHARRIATDDNRASYARTLREAIYENRYRTLYHATAIIGLDESFTVKAHLLIPEGFENTLYSWMLNFQNYTEDVEDMYENSTVFEEGDILLYSDPDYFLEGFETGFALFDREHNCGALLGLRYFGEHKKGSLTMAWTIAERADFTACHGGLKRFRKGDGSFVMGVFGLSGSGKSTLTHAKHDSRYDITVLHDDAFIINNKDLSSVAMEPTYFDKVADYPTNSPDNRFLLTVQNTGATVDEDGLVVPVTEDIRNGNGRAVKSSFWTPERAYAFTEVFNAVFWIMKDDTLPPILKIEDPALASTMGATLATKRSSAEEGADPDKLAFVPYANPFRLYPLEKDYESFKRLFNEGVDCYILNTGHFRDKKITPETTLSIIEEIVEGNAAFEAFGPFETIKYRPVEGFTPDFKDTAYTSSLKKRLKGRLDYLQGLKGEETLPEEAKESLRKTAESIGGEHP